MPNEQKETADSKLSSSLGIACCMQTSGIKYRKMKNEVFQIPTRARAHCRFLHMASAKYGDSQIILTSWGALGGLGGVRSWQLSGCNFSSAFPFKSCAAD